MEAATTYDKLKQSIRYWLLRNLPACEGIVQTISQSMERKLTLRERFTLKLHLLVCAWCQWYMEHLRMIRYVASAQTPDTSASPRLSDEARERIRQKLISPI